MNIFGKLADLLGRRRERQIENVVGMIVLARDAEQPLHNQVDDQLILRFFLNEEDACIPHRHGDIVNFTDDDMERHHDFIQWIFPTSQPSRFYFKAPTIDEHFAVMLHGSPYALQNIANRAAAICSIWILTAMGMKMSIHIVATDHFTGCLIIIFCV